MCIIIYKPQGMAVPARDILENCWVGNSDGAGIAWYRNKETILLKGFMEFRELSKALKTLKIRADDKLLIHFRYATHGTISRENTHPFIVSSELEDVRKVYSITNQKILAHNGILPYRPRNTHISDTMEFILQNNSTITTGLTKNSHDNRFALIDNGNVELYGKWIYENGLFYSNDGYRKSYLWDDIEETEETKQDDLCPECFGITYQGFCWNCGKDILELTEN